MFLKPRSLFKYKFKNKFSIEFFDNFFQNIDYNMTCEENNGEKNRQSRVLKVSRKDENDFN